MEPLRLMIVDDEPLARERLRALLPDDWPLTIVGEYDNGPEAIVAIRRDRPDLVFLDVQMPGCDGLQVVAELPLAERPAIVFVTAHDKFAVEAFAVQAIDYLLKPFDQERLRTALQRAVDHMHAQRAGDLGTRLENLLAKSEPTARKPERFAVKADGRVIFLQPGEIAWVEAADNYVILHLGSGERVMVRETLAALEDRLGKTSFARVNRSAIVQLDQVKELQPTAHGDYLVILRDGTRLPLSRGLRGSFAKFAGDLL